MDRKRNVPKINNSRDYMHQVFNNICGVHVLIDLTWLTSFEKKKKKKEYPAFGANTYRPKQKREENEFYYVIFNQLELNMSTQTCFSR